MMLDVAGAIETAAGADDPRLSSLHDSPLAVSARRRVAAARNLIRRFLEHVPDDACVLELKRAIEEDGGDR
jgi:hypothetical protein